MQKGRARNATQHNATQRNGMTEGGSLILPWPNTKANVRKVLHELLAEGWSAKIKKTTYETYVWTNATMSSARRGARRR